MSTGGATVPQIKRIVDVSISPPNVIWSNRTKEEEKYLQLNAQASYVLTCALSEDIYDSIMDDDDIHMDAHCIWTTLKERYGKSKCDDEVVALEESFEKCSTSSRINKEPQEEEAIDRHRSNEESTSPSDCEDEDLELGQMSGKDNSNTTKFEKIIENLEGRLERQNEHLIEKIKELKALTKEHKKLKDSHASLVSMYEKLSIKHICATNSSSCVAQLENANCRLKAQIEELPSKHVDLQEKYDDLSCSHEKLVDSHVMLGIAHEVMVTSIKSYQPHIHNCTCSQVQIKLSCANPCYSQANCSCRN
uniref:Uncharacterized protein n=1 Tax=Setaria italica TaxID=4555 RepID=K4ALG0_SETIT